MKEVREELKGMTVSEGTMREEDLVPAFLGVLRKFVPEAAEELQRRADQLPIVTDEYGTRYADSDEAYWLMEDLWDAMHDIAPEDHYFGAHPGNGSDYGFWKMEEE